MVKYYGRARQRTGSVNRNQPGLKMSGSAPSIGRQGYIIAKMARRVQAHAVVECVSGSRQLASQRLGTQRKYMPRANAPDGHSVCVAPDPGALLIPAAPNSRQCAGGVNRYFPLGFR